MAKKVKTFRKRIIGWSHGRDPSEYGWVIDGSHSLSSSDLEEYQSLKDLPFADDIVAAIREDIGEGPYKPSFHMALDDWFQQFN